MLHSDPRQSFVLATAGMIARGETEKLAMLDQYYAATTVLLEAVDKSRARNSCLQPVHVRNTGLLEAWERWPGAYARDCGPELEYRMRDPAFCFGENEYLFSQCLELDPILASVKRRGLEEEFKYSSIMVAAALMFWQRPHALIELTPALDKLLASSDISQDIPAQLMRPPFPACYISFGKATQTAVAVPEADTECDGHRIVGAYVFESPSQSGARKVSICPVSELNTNEERFVGHLEILIEDEGHSLLEIIHRTCAEVELRPTFLRQQQALALLCTKVFLYWSMEHARRIEEKPHSVAIARLRAVGPKKAAKLRRQAAALYDRVMLGPMALPAHLEAGRGDISPHWRRGHFRMQAHGPQLALRKVIFIAPTLVRADRLADEPNAAQIMRNAK